MPRHVTAVVVCGPSGVGKTTIGQELATLLDCPFAEGDDFHTEAHKEKMRSGIPLTDEDRAPWLHRLQAEVLAPCRGRGRVAVVLACSALRRRYRDVLRGMDQAQSEEEAAELLRHTEIFFLLLSGDAKVVEQRLNARTGHYMSAKLLESQLATLEALEPTELGATTDLADAPVVIVKKATELVHLASSSL